MHTTIEKPAAEHEHEDQGELTVADAVWVGTALMHSQDNLPGPFSTEQIVDFVSQKRLTKGSYKTIWQHVNQHCVANRKPQPNRARMLFATGGGNRRLYRDTDTYHEERDGAPTHPQWDKLPARYRNLKRWYEQEWNGTVARAGSDPLLDLIGSGTHIWNHEDADLYVARLRENWGDRQ